MYRRGAQGWLKHLDFIMLDLVCLQLSFMLAYAVRMCSFNPYGEEIYRNIAAVILFADLVVGFVFDSFKNVLKRGFYRELIMTVRHVCLVEAFVIIYLFTVQKSSNYSRIVIYLMAVFYLFFGYFTRILWKNYLAKRLAVQKRKRSLLIITVESMAEEVVANIKANSYEQFVITGIAIIDRNIQGEKLCGIPVVAGAENAADSVCHNWVDEVLIALPYGVPYPEELVAQFSAMGIVVHKRLFQTGMDDGLKQFVERLGDYMVLTTSINYATPMQQFVKRGIDIAGGIVGSLITCVLFVFLAPAIYIMSPGPVFFAQERVGRNGKHFKMYKFRSMYPNAEEKKKELMEKNRCDSGLMFKLEADPRIIGCKIRPDGTVKKGIGNFMRDFSLDEFPQFFNVLKGDMSLVGTRPPTVDEWEHYELHHRARLAVKPGITGLWQISGRSNIKDFEEVVRLDTKYITEWSMGLDLRILFKTVQVVLKRDGAL